MQNLQQRVERVERWREAFSDDTTGIHKTVQDLLWNYTAFRTTIQIVRLSNEQKDSEAGLNQMLFNLVAEGYWSSLLLGTRRLLDRYPLKGSKGVYSIRSVVEDVKACSSWLDRKFYVEVLHHAEYDTALMQQKEHEKLSAAKGAVWGNPEFIKNTVAHRYFDKLSGVSPADRSPNDLISPVIFEKIEARLVALKTITDHVDTHIAHAGNKESRLNRGLENFHIKDALATLRQLKELASFTGTFFANQGGAGLATFIGDQFEGLDRPMVGSTQMQELENQWHAIEQEIARWSIDVDGL